MALAIRAAALSMAPLGVPVVPDVDTTPIRIPLSLRAAVVITAVLTIAIGVYPGLVTRLSDSTNLCPTKTECVASGPN